jgi:hypothetical protein
VSRLFPEIDGKAPAPPRAPPPPPQSDPAAPWIHRFERLLDLRRRSPGAHLLGLSRVGPARLKLEIGGFADPLALYLSARAAPSAEGDPRPRGATIHTPQLVIERPGPPSTAEVVDLMRYLAYRIHNAPMELLLRAAAGAPIGEEPGGAGHWEQDSSGDTRGQAPADGARLGEIENEDSFVFSYASPSAWRNFFEGQEIYRGACGGIEGNVLMVHHTEIECHASTVPLRDGTMNFFNYVRSEPGAPGQGAFLMTDLDDRDVIKGGSNKLDRILDGVAKSALRPDMILVQSSCVPIVTGDDVDASIDKLRKKVRVPVLNLDNSSDPSAELVRLAMAEPGFFTAEKRPGSINLVGLPTLPGHAELFEALADCEITLNCRLLPSVDLGSFRRYLAAELQVHYCWDWQSPACRELIAKIPLPAIEPPPPFGLEGSRAWLAAVAGALGRGERFEQVWADRCAPVRAEWEALCAEARGYRLGFIVDDRSLEKIADPRRLMGIPVLDVLREMGFGLDVLAYRAPGAAAPRSPLLALPGVALLPFASRAELEEQLRSSEAVAFYSELHFDRRLSRTGKNLFSMKDFEMGPRGALRMARRLLARCRLPFFRSYSSYLGDPFTPGAALPREGSGDER